MEMKRVNHLLEHVRTLAAEYGVCLDLDPSRDPLRSSAKVVGGLPIVESGAMESLVTYAIVLHEMGHLIAEGGRDPAGRKPIPERDVLDWMCTIEEEDAAWRWAMEHALVWTPEMTKIHHWARETYRLQLELKMKSKIPVRHRHISEWR